MLKKRGSGLPLLHLRVDERSNDTSLQASGKVSHRRTTSSRLLVVSRHGPLILIRMDPWLLSLDLLAHREIERKDTEINVSRCILEETGRNVQIFCI